MEQVEQRQSGSIGPKLSAAALFFKSTCPQGTRADPNRCKEGAGESQGPPQTCTHGGGGSGGDGGSGGGGGGGCNICVVLN